MIPPHDLLAERSVLGSLILDGSLAQVVADVLEPSDFYAAAHEAVYDAAMSIHSQGHPIDSVTIRANLARANTLEGIGGDELLHSLLDVVPTAHNIAHHAAIVRDKSLQRKIQRACYDVIGLIQEGTDSAASVIADADQRLAAISKSIKSDKTRHIKGPIEDAYKSIIAAAEKGSSITGVPSGFAGIDRLTSGFQPGDMVVLAARPSMGKTSLALNIAENACDASGKVVLVFSMEMSASSLAMRMVSGSARVDSTTLRIGKLQRGDWPKMTKASTELSNKNLWICDEPALTPTAMRARALRLAAREDLGLVVVDYLQLMRAGRRIDSLNHQVTEISQSLKALAIELNVPVLVLSQLNRSLESRTDKRPIPADLRDSGAIEQDADVIAFIYRDEVYNKDTQDKGVAEVILAKQRNGPLGVVRLRFFGEYTRFESLEEWSK